MLRSLTIPPDKPLQSLVCNIMVLEKTAAAGVVTQLPFYADGYPGLVFQQSEGGTFMNGSDSCVPDFFLYGQTVKPIILSPIGSFRAIVFYLYPASINALFGISSAELRDTCVNLKFIPGLDLQFSIQQLLDTMHLQEQIDIISRYLFRLQSTVAQPDNVVQYALQHIIRANGQAPLSTLRRQLNVTERTFERKFEQLVGISPKLFSRICQFRSTLDQLHMKDFIKLSDLAYNNGYSDQSHFIRSFKEFTGKTPLEYIKEGTLKQKELVED